MLDNTKSHPVRALLLLWKYGRNCPGLDSLLRKHPKVYKALPFLQRRRNTVVRYKIAYESHFDAKLVYA